MMLVLGLDAVQSQCHDHQWLPENRSSARTLDGPLHGIRCEHCMHAGWAGAYLLQRSAVLCAMMACSCWQ